MSFARILQRKSTVLWEGDVIVLGAGLAGLSTAIRAARAGKRTCVIEAGPTLGTETSGMWLDTMPPCDLSQCVKDLCAEKSALRDDRLDILLATIAFDRIAEADSIAAIVRVQPVRPVLDGGGLLAGVEVVGKSGRQVALAPVVVDATEGRFFTRRAVGTDPAGIVKAERRMYVAGDTLPTEPRDCAVDTSLGVRGDSVHVSPAVWQGEALVSFQVSGCEGEHSSALLLATYEKALDVMAWLREKDPHFVGATLIDVAPQCRFTFPPDPAEWRPPVDTGLLCLPMDESVDHEVARTEEAVNSIPGRNKRIPLRLAAAPDTVADLQSAELAAAPEWDFAPALLPDAVARLHEPCDVLVAGYGTAGAFAALAAGERGSSVTALDPACLPGGIETAGRISGYYHGLTGGVQDRLDELTAGRTAGLGESRGYHPLAKAGALLMELRNARVRICQGHTVFGVVKRGKVVEGVLSVDAHGYHAFPCKTVVDCTGDGDVAAAAGAHCELGRQEDGFPQPYSYTPSMFSEGKLAWHNFDAGWVDPCDTLDYSRAHFEGRRRIWEKGPFSQENHYCTLASLLGVRESRFVRGGVTPTFADFLDGKTYPDTVCAAYAHYDNHAVDYAQESDWARRYVALFGGWRAFCTGEVPYRCLVPEDVDGLLVGCRALSVDHDLHQLLRMQRDLQKIGEICGIAASMCAERVLSPSGLDVQELRAHLRSRGILPASAPEIPLPVSPAELLNRLGTEDKAIAVYRLSRLTGDEAPDWEAVLAEEQDADTRFQLAIACSLSASPSGSAGDVLYEAALERDRDKGGARHEPARWVAAGLALCEMRDRRALETVRGLLSDQETNALDAMLLMKGLDILADPEGAGAIHEFLARVDSDDFVLTLSGGAVKESLRPTVELCAVRSLLALGDASETARLNPYLGSSHLLTRRYARRLAQKAGATLGR